MPTSQPITASIVRNSAEPHLYGNHTQHSTYPIITIRLRHNVHSGHLTEMLGDETVPFRKRQDDRHKRQDDKQQQTAEQTCQVYRTPECPPPSAFLFSHDCNARYGVSRAKPDTIQRQRYKRMDSAWVSLNTGMPVVWEITSAISSSTTIFTSDSPSRHEDSFLLAFGFQLLLLITQLSGLFEVLRP